MNLYDIPDELYRLYEDITDENGEVDEEIVKQMENLGIKRDEKEINVSLYIKELSYEIGACETEEARIKRKKENLKKRRKYFKNMLAFSLDGRKINTPQVSVYFRKSESVKVDDGFIDYARKHNLNNFYRKTVDYKVKKAEIKKELKEGKEIPYCELEVKQNIQIK